MIKKILKKYKKIDAIEKFRDKNDSLITYEELEKIPLNEMIQIVPDSKGAIECTRITSNNENLMFTVSMKEGQLWEKHHHDCDETCIVFKGRLRDTLNDRVAGRAQMLECKAYQSHHVISEEDTIFYVEFKKIKQ